MELNPWQPQQQQPGSGIDQDGGRETGDQNVSTTSETNSQKRRRSRWGPQPQDDDQNASEGGAKKRKSRWAADQPKSALGQIQLPNFVRELTGGVDLDPELQALNIKLLDINRKLQTGQMLDNSGDGNRSPSPEPIYDNMGIRINTREYRAREELRRERQEVISQLIKMNPTFKPPADYRPPKLYKKLFIPVKDYPGYSFIGQIIGPRGNTQKRMEKETRAKIVIRGKGSVKEGRSQRKQGMQVDLSENEDLHVLIQADTAHALEKAAHMVEKLLVPVEDDRNEHKQAQLRDLWIINGTIRDDEYCHLCGEPGHRQYACPARHSTSKSDISCRSCGDGGHPTIDCPLKNSAQGNKMDDEYQSFLAELGGANRVSQQGGGAQAAPAGKFATDGHDVSNLYVGYLPYSVDDEGLLRLFGPFGRVQDSTVIRDRLNGSSKGYGFVEFADPAAAAEAVAHMNGYWLDGKILAVRVARREVTLGAQRGRGGASGVPPPWASNPVYAAPPAGQTNAVQLEYERFMSDMSY